MTTCNPAHVIDSLLAAGSSLRELAFSSEAMLVDRMHHLGYDNIDAGDVLDALSDLYVEVYDASYHRF